MSILISVLISILITCKSLMGSYKFGKFRAKYLEVLISIFTFGEVCRWSGGLPLEWSFAAGVRGLPLGWSFAAGVGGLALECAHKAPEKNALNMDAQRQLFHHRVP